MKRSGVYQIFWTLCALVTLFGIERYAHALDADVMTVFLNHDAFDISQVPNGFSATDQVSHSIDRNIIELSTMSPSSHLTLSIARTFPDRTVFYRAGTELTKTSKWLDLFDRSFLSGTGLDKLSIPGHISSIKTSSPFDVITPKLISKLIPKSQDANRNRILFVYGHGQGPSGLNLIQIADLKALLTEAGPFDLIWFDSCFMGNIEALYELRNTAKFFIVSEDSEFSEGFPFESLQDILSESTDIESLTISLSKAFLSSYSILKKGNQRAAVETSPAVSAVVDSQRLGAWVEEKKGRLSELLKSIANDLSIDPNQKIRLGLSKYLSKFRMEDPSMVDLGRFLWVMIQSTYTSIETKRIAKDIMTDLDVSTSIGHQTSPRITVTSPVEKAVLVYGYNGFSRGFEGDIETIAKLPADLEPKFYVQYGAKKFPARFINKRLYLSPFIPGTKSFDYAILDPTTGHPIGGSFSKIIEKDIYSSTAKSDTNPIRFIGTTQGSGKVNEKYTGLNIIDPFIGSNSLDYFDLDFAKVTGWGSF